MLFNKSKVYTAVNADELEVGSAVYVANDLSTLKRLVESGTLPKTLAHVEEESNCCRFGIYFDEGVADRYTLAYLVEEHKSLKWTDLKIGDVLKDKCHGIQAMVTAIDSREDTISHIFISNMGWILDIQLVDNFIKVEYASNNGDR